jgi:hypothetical protein
MELNTLKDLYIHELKDLFSVEQQLVKALPKMAKAASNKELASGFQEHLEQTKGHAQRLEQILSSHNATTRGAKCKGMEGIVAEGAEMIEEEADGEVKDDNTVSYCYQLHGLPPVSFHGFFRSAVSDKTSAPRNLTILELSPDADKAKIKISHLRKTLLFLIQVRFQFLLY